MASLNINPNNLDPFYRYKMPKLCTKIEGRGNGIKTLVVNMEDISKALYRPPTYATKYFGCELGAQVQIDAKNSRYIVNGVHTDKDLQDLLYRFIVKYVLCPSCENPETDLRIKPDLQKINARCVACGWRGEFDPNHKLAGFIIKNPPDESYSHAARHGDKEKKSSSSSKKSKSSSEAGAATTASSKSSSKASTLSSKESVAKEKKDKKDKHDETPEEKAARRAARKAAKEKEAMTASGGDQPCSKEKKKKSKSASDANEDDTHGKSSGNGGVSGHDDHDDNGTNDNDDDDDDWELDMSEEAVAQRRMEHEAAIKSSTIEKLYNTNDTPADQLSPLSLESQLEAFRTYLSDCSLATAPKSEKEIYNEAIRLDIDSKCAHILIEVLLNDQLLSQGQLKKHARLFKTFASSRASFQRDILAAMDKLIGQSYPTALLNKVPAIFNELYQLDIIDEAVFGLWMRTCPDAKLVEKAQPFLDYLTQPDDDDDDEEEDDNCNQKTGSAASDDDLDIENI